MEYPFMNPLASQSYHKHTYDTELLSSSAKRLKSGDSSEEATQTPAAAASASTTQSQRPVGAAAAAAAAAASAAMTQPPRTAAAAAAAAAAAPAAAITHPSANAAAQFAAVQMLTLQALEEYQNALNEAALKFQKVQEAIGKQVQTFRTVASLTPTDQLNNFHAFPSTKKLISLYSVTERNPITSLQHSSTELQHLTESLGMNSEGLIMENLFSRGEDQRWSSDLIDLSLIPLIVTQSNKMFVELQSTSYNHAQWKKFFNTLNHLFLGISNNLDPQVKNSFQGLMNSIRSAFIKNFIDLIIKKFTTEIAQNQFYIRGQSYDHDYQTAGEEGTILLDEFITVSNNNEKELLLQQFKQAGIDLEDVAIYSTRYLFYSSLDFLVNTGIKLTKHDYFAAVFRPEDIYHSESDIQKRGSVGWRQMCTCHRLIVSGLKPSNNSIKNLLKRYENSTSTEFACYSAFPLFRQLVYAEVNFDYIVYGKTYNVNYYLRSYNEFNDPDRFKSNRDPFTYHYQTAIKERDKAKAAILESFSKDKIKLTLKTAEVIHIPEILGIIADYAATPDVDPEYLRIATYKRCMNVS